MELLPLNISPIKLGLDSTNTTPIKPQTYTRYTMTSPPGHLNSAPEKATLLSVKRSSEKPKSSFLSRVSSRPSLSARYSSADLKSSSKNRASASARNRDLPVQRPKIVHSTPDVVHTDTGVDRDFFVSPRAAPSPPNLIFATPSSFSHGSPNFDGPSQSTITLPSQKRESQLFYNNGSVHVTDTPVSSLTTQAKITSRVTAASGPTAADINHPYRTARNSPYNSKSETSTVSSPSQDIGKSREAQSMLLGQVRRRTGLVRIGREEVTLSVANILETELGVDVVDSEDESIYSNGGEEVCSLSELKVRPCKISQSKDLAANEQHVSRDLPSPALPDNDFFLNESIGKSGDDGTASIIEHQSPLSVLISAAAANESLSNDIHDASSHPLYLRSEEPLRNCSVDRKPQSLEKTVPRSDIHSKAPLLLRDTILDANNVPASHLDRISEKSMELMSSEHKCPEHEHQAKGNNNNRVVNDCPDYQVQQLQCALNVQCERFDRLAKHLLEIIHRHQNEKLQLEGQITSLEKEAKKREKEIKSLRALLRDNNPSRGKSEQRRLSRLASMQSLLSAVSNDSKDMDLSLAIDILTKRGIDRCSSLYSNDEDKKSSVNISPIVIPEKLEIKSILKRSKTMPDLHGTGIGRGAGLGPLPPTPQQSPSPDISGLGLGLEFPLPEPLTFPSFSSTLTSTSGSNSSVPALTAAPTAASGLSFATKQSTESICTPIKTARVEKPSSREKRRAGEWCPDIRGRYQVRCPSPSPTPSTSAMELTLASVAYANNLNKTRGPSIVQILRDDDKRLNMPI